MTETEPLIYIGKKGRMNYISESIHKLTTYNNILVKARGRLIPEAVDVALVLRGLGKKILGIEISTDVLKDDRDNVRNVSVIAIKISN
jgi:DNA-binding protein Alba